MAVVSEPVFSDCVEVTAELVSALKGLWQDGMAEGSCVKMNPSSYLNKLLAVARACREEGLLDDALRTLSEARSMASKIEDRYHEPHALAAIAHEYAKLSKREEASRLLAKALLQGEQLYAPYMPPYKFYSVSSHASLHGKLLQRVISTYCEIGDVPRALQVTKMIDYPGSLWAAGLCIELHLAGCDRPHEAYEVFQSMPCFRNTALSAIAASAVRTGNRELALRIVEKEFEEFYRAFALARVASEFDKYGERDIASKLMQRAIQEIHTEEDLLDNKAERFALMVRDLCGMGWTREAEKLLAEADQLAAEIEDVKYRTEALAEIEKSRRRLNACKSTR